MSSWPASAGPLLPDTGASTNIRSGRARPSRAASPVVAATPIELLQRDWTSIYTWPQTTTNQNILAAINGKYLLTDNWTLQSNVYVRSFRQAHQDGNGANVERCSDASSFPNQLCLQSGFALHLSRFALCLCNFLELHRRLAGAVRFRVCHREIARDIGLERTLRKIAAEALQHDDGPIPLLVLDEQRRCVEIRVRANLRGRRQRRHA